jgi:hypothetical protein
MARKVRVKRVSHEGKSVNLDLTAKQAARMISRIAAKIATKTPVEVIRVTIWPSGTFSVWIP